MQAFNVQMENTSLRSLSLQVRLCLQAFHSSRACLNDGCVRMKTVEDRADVEYPRVEEVHRTG